MIDELTKNPNPLSSCLGLLQLRDQPCKHAGRVALPVLLVHPEVLLIPEVGIDADDTEPGAVDNRVAAIVR